MTGCRPLYRSGRDPAPPSTGAPQGQSRAAQEARRELGDYLNDVLMRPLYFDDLQRMAQIEEALTTLTPGERVFLEIEMLERRGDLYTVDYDPLRF